MKVYIREHKSISIFIFNRIPKQIPCDEWLKVYFIKWIFQFIGLNISYRWNTL